MVKIKGEAIMPRYSDKMFMRVLTYEEQGTGLIASKVGCTLTTARTYLNIIAANPKNKVVRVKVSDKPLYTWKKIK